jgi:hypothetical protein
MDLATICPQTRSGPGSGTHSRPSGGIGGLWSLGEGVRRDETVSATALPRSDPAVPPWRRPSRDNA